MGSMMWKVDVDLLNSFGRVASARYVQVQAARLMCISRRWELQGLEEESSKKADALELERKLLLATEQVALKEKENGMLKEENDELKARIAKLSKDKKDLETRVEVCGERKEAEVSKKAHGFEMLAAAWDRAKAQAELFAPGVSFDKMDPVKVIYKGELVDDDQIQWKGVMTTILPSDVIVFLKILVVFKFGVCFEQYIGVGFDILSIVVIPRTVSRADRTGFPPTVLNWNKINVRKHIRKLVSVREHEHLH
ncbi:hypothetical protein PIB30_039794 [Stylosanthes scabra]|uniref:Uncharacterized protein n=1 Tax=Stylosanthes scabra TaxID=79078 RepID=A0ABU6XD88_9FABA|nr:hypothetical protein [Stylosanthes scabra]